jgi:hypothetical protein
VQERSSIHRRFGIIFQAIVFSKVQYTISAKVGILTAALMR